MRPHFLLSLLALGLLAGSASAQAPATQFGFTFGSTAKIMQGADTLSQAWVGGLNTPQFGNIDLNGDGLADLYAFDRETARSYTFLNVAKATGGRRYQYAPSYERIFPADLQSWVQLRDYDCDGRMDLFTRAEGSDIRVFHNVAGPGGVPTFVLANNQLTYPYGTYNININTGYCNVPSIQDVNGDGRLDIVTPDFISGSYLEVYLNTSTGGCGGISSFSIATNYWGQLASCLTTCAGYQLNGATCQSFARLNHCAGYAPLLLDLNGDGKMDLLEGRDNCPQLTRLLNSGASSVSAAFVAGDVTSAFPASTPVNLSMFPAATLLDVTFDGVPELLVAPAMLENSQDFVSMRRNILQYQNKGTSAVPNFSFVTNSFLQSDMLDVSEGAAPTFGDIDGDGLTDMLVGNRGDLVSGYYRASIYYYHNVGSAHKPVFQLVTDDYLGLAATAALTPTTGFQTLQPQLVDINRDGALDLVYSVYQTIPPSSSNPVPTQVNYLYYIVNTASAMQAVAFNPANASFFKPQGAVGTGVLPSLHYDAPCFFDVDNDGYVDMLLGTGNGPEPGYSLRYFHNQGPKANGNLDNLFVLADNDYGTLRDANTFDHRFYNLAPMVADFDKDGQPDLLTVDFSATVRLYSNFRNQGTAFTERTDLFFNQLTRQFEPARLGSQNVYGAFNRFVPAAADLNQDGKLELYIGTESGGIVSYLSGPASSLVALASQTAAQTLGLGLYPNPATASATLETALPTSVRVLDLTGRLVQQDDALLRSHSLDLRGLAAGVYLVQATAADGTRATQRLSVQ